VKEELGCESSASTVITQSVGVDILDLEVCEEDLPITIDGSVVNGTSYSWSGGSSPSSAANTFNDGGQYTITAVDGFGCESIDTFQLEVVTIPEVQIEHSHVANYFFFSSANSTGVGNNASYFWSFGDGNTSTDPNPQHAYAWTGSPLTYTVSLTIANDCGTSQSSEVVGLDPLGYEEISDDQLSLFPNPTNGMLNLTVKGLWNDATITVYDVSGRVVLEQAERSLNTTSLDVSGLSPGFYNLSVASANGFGQLSFIKE
jgi:hypothetical protein